MPRLRGIRLFSLMLSSAILVFNDTEKIAGAAAERILRSAQLRGVEHPLLHSSCILAFGDAADYDLCLQRGHIYMRQQRRMSYHITWQIRPSWYSQPDPPKQKPWRELARVEGRAQQGSSTPASLPSPASFLSSLSSAAASSVSNPSQFSRPYFYSLPLFPLLIFIQNNEIKTSRRVQL